MAESQVQSIRVAATDTISSLKEKEQSMKAHAEERHKEQEQENMNIRREMENAKLKNAQLETKLQEMLLLKADSSTQVQGHDDPGPVGRYDDGGAVATDKCVRSSVNCSYECREQLCFWCQKVHRKVFFMPADQPMPCLPQAGGKAMHSM